MGLVVGAVGLDPNALRRDLRRIHSESLQGLEGHLRYARFKERWALAGGSLLQILSLEDTQGLSQFLYQESLALLSLGKSLDSQAAVLFLLHALYSTQPLRYFPPTPILLTPRAISYFSNA
jgi:hypothetical protein